MAIRKRGNSWQIDVLIPTYKRDEDGKEIKERYRRTFKKKKDAVAEHDKIRTLVREKRFLDVKKEYKSRFGELLVKYEPAYKHQTSFKNWKRFCVKNFKDHFGENTPLASIGYMDVEIYRNHLRQKPCKNGNARTDAAVNREMSCLHHIFSKAVEWDMIGGTPFDTGKSLLTEENNQRLRYLTPEELERLLSECTKHLRRILICAVNTGMDRGEILRLRWDQIRNGFIYLPRYKTRPVREIPVNDDLKELFKEIRREQMFISEYVFTYAKNEDKLKGTQPVRKRKGLAPVAENLKSIRNGFNAAVKRAGIKDFRFKDLRHTFASHMVMRGASMKEIQELMGHKTMNMTMRYAHLSQEHKKKAVNLLNGLTAFPAKKSMSQNVTSSDLIENPSQQAAAKLLK